MGLVAGNVGVKAILEVFRCLPFYRSGHGSGYIMGLVAGNVGVKASLVIFNLLPADFFGRGAGGYYCVGAVHALGEGDFVSCAVICFTYNAASEIFGDGEGFGTISYSNLSLLCILADGGGLAFVHCFVFHGEGAVVIADHASGDVLVGGVWYCVIAQVLADFFRPYGGFSCGVYGPFIGSGGDRAAVFIENGFCSIFHSAIDFMNFGCYLAFIDIGLVECFASQGNMVRFEIIGNFQTLGGELIIDYHIISCNGTGSGDVYRICETAAGKGSCAVTDTGALYFTAGGYHIAAGGNISGGCDGSHSGKSAAFHAGSAIGDSMAGDRTGSGDVFAGNIFTGNIAGCGNIFTRNIAGAGIDITIAGQDITAIGIYAAIGCYFAICINRKLSSRSFDGAAGINFKVSIRSFDGTISIESRFCSIRHIAAGKYAVRCNDGTVLAHFDAIFIHGNLIITIFVQHQFIYSRGCGAVVSGDFGNHAVPIYFEVILVGRFASILFSRNFPINFRFCVCIGNAISFQGRCFICLFIQGRVNFCFRVRISNAVSCQVCRLICFSIQGSIGFCFRVRISNAVSCQVCRLICLTIQGSIGFCFRVRIGDAIPCQGRCFISLFCKFCVGLQLGVHFRSIHTLAFTF